MLEHLTRYWWVVAVRGVAALLFGLLALIWPDITISALVLLFGAFALVDGVFTVAAAFGDRRAEGRRGWLLLQGLAGVAAGVVTFAWPGITTLVLLWWIAAWALVTGVLAIAAAIRLRRELEGEWLLALSGAVSVLFGILLAVRPDEGAVALAWLIGSYAIVFGVALLTLAWRLRRLGRTSSSAGRRPAAA
jgi:uncharacterized membrane protein HdeD (DUF308 family)